MHGINDVKEPDGETRGRQSDIFKQGVSLHRYENGQSVKTIVLSRRRPDLTRDAFRDYYETQHVPMAIRHVRFTKYVRNHLVAPSNAEFDVVSEFQLADPVTATALATSPIGETLREDAAKFMAEERFTAAAEESLLAGPPRAFETGRVKKYALLLNRRAYAGEADFIADARDWGRRLAAEAKAKRVMIDIIKPYAGGRFPADAILWLWHNRTFDAGLLESPPKSLEVSRVLTLDAFETPRDKLDAATLIQ
jgi:hypothetical protein